MRLIFNQYTGWIRRSLDLGEFVRFLFSGGLSTLINLAAVWVARHFVSFEGALVVGLVFGSSTSFLMSKLFAFRSRTWGKSPGEAARFLLVYGVGLVIYWLVSVDTRGLLISVHVQPQFVDLAAVLAGAAVMTPTSYFGHRFFTYRRSAPAA